MAQIDLYDVAAWLIERARWAKSDAEYECLWSIIRAIDDYR